MAPPTAMTGAEVRMAPVAPSDWSSAKALPAATLPIPAWMPAATDPAATPLEVKPSPDTMALEAIVPPAPTAAPIPKSFAASIFFIQLL